MSQLTQKWKRQGYGNGTNRRVICLLGLLLSLTLLTNACGAFNQGRSSTPEPIGNGGVMDSSEIFMSANDSKPRVGDGLPVPTVQAFPEGSGTDMSPLETPAQVVPSAPSPGNVSPGSAEPVKPSTEAAKSPLPEATKSPLPITSATGPKQASAENGIIIRSGNILSTSEKEILLNELETELNGLFRAIDQVSAEQQADQAE